MSHKIAAGNKQRQARDKETHRRLARVASPLVELAQQTQHVAPRHVPGELRIDRAMVGVVPRLLGALDVCRLAEGVVVEEGTRMPPDHLGEVRRRVRLDAVPERLPAGARRLNLNNLSFIFVALVARLTFVEVGDKMDYGSLDDRKYTQDKYEEVQAWLMDADRCPTVWPELLRIRAENPNYHA